MPTNRLEQTNKYLKEKILQWLPRQGQITTLIKGLMLSRIDQISMPESCIYKPMIATVIQGFKYSMIGNEEYFHGSNHYMVVGVDLSGVHHITQASPEEPFLSVSIGLDRYIINQLLTELPSKSTPPTEPVSPVITSHITNAMLDAFLRLIELLDKPASIPILAPMIIREIHFHLINSVHEECCCLVNSCGTKVNQISRAINWLKKNYAEPLDVNNLARSVNMSSSTFHRHFRQFTTLSPLQFQKQLRLYEAERLMLLEGKDVKTVAYQVGYESPSQFSREYKRQFGEAPYRDVEKKRTTTP